MIKSGKGVLVKLFLILFAAFFVSGICSSEAFAESQWNTQCTTNLEQFQDDALSFQWWQEPFRIVSEATITVGETTFNTVAPGAIKLMTVGFLLWLVIFMMKNLSSLKEVDPMEMLTKVGGMMFKTGFAYCMLINSNFFFGTFVSPITATAAGFVGLDSGGGGGLQSVVSPLREMMEEMHKALAAGIGAGNYAKCLSWWKVFGDPLPNFFKNDEHDGYPEPEVYAAGCVVWLGCWILSLVFPFYLFDAMIRLGVTAALCPLFIVAWVFPITVEFAKKGLESVLNVAFLFVCLKIILDLDVELLLTSSGIKTNLVGSKRAFMDAIREGNNLIVACVCIFYSILFSLQATPLASFFSGADFKNDTAWQATQYAGRFVGKTAKAGAGLAAMGGRRIRQDLDRAAARKVERGRQAREKDPTAKPTKTEKAAARYLRSRGYLDSKGRYKDGMEGLLTNGVRRGAKRVGYRGLGRAMDKTGLTTAMDKLHLGGSKIRSWLQQREDKKRNLIEDVPDDVWSPRK
ncbi:unknown [Acetobacter sp. CAG:977]|nr:unknown [Acetobacter sp. CAG:977]